MKSAELCKTVVTLLSMAALACTRAPQSGTQVKIHLPELAVSQNATLPVGGGGIGGGGINPVSPGSAPAATSGWGLAAPETIADVSCFAVAIEVPGQPTANCLASDGTIIAQPTVAIGSLPAGSDIVLDVSSGPARRILVFGFKATEAAACGNFLSADFDRSKMSAPLVLGQSTVNLQPGSQSVDVVASITGAVPFYDCSGPPFMRTATAIAGAMPALTTVSPNSGSILGGEMISIYGTGFSGGSFKVSLGNSPCVSVIVASDTQLSCISGVSPAPQLIDVLVTRLSDGAVAALKSSFSYVTPP